MPRSDRPSYTDKQRRQAEHIEDGYKHMRRQVPAIIAIVALLAILALAVVFMVSAWRRFPAPMSAHGWVALILAVLFSIMLGCGLMALMFFSSRRGYDDQPHASDFHREVP